jgi:hypothetical protein
MPFNKILLLGTAENVEQADPCGITLERIIIFYKKRASVIVNYIRTPREFQPSCP